MTTAVPTKASTPSHARTVLSVFQLGDENTLNHHGLRPDRLLDRVNNIVYNGYDAVSRYIVRASHRTATPTRVDPETQPVNGHRDTNTGQSRNGTLSHLTLNHNNLSTSETNDPEEPVQLPVIQPPVTHSKQMQMWVAALIVGILFLIVTPGVVLGIVTRQLPWGIALSGAIATVVSFLAGLYYHLHK